MNSLIWSVGVMVSLSLVLASNARADCIVAGRHAGYPGLGDLVVPRSVATGPAVAVPTTARTSIVGLWVVTFRVGDGPGVYDKGFEQWHADGTEFTMDVAVPPAAGNVCVGVWVPTGPRSAKLHHVGWNWDTSLNPAALAGTFVLDMNATVDANGTTFTG